MSVTIPQQILEPKFDYHIVLIEPEIPPNTGNAGRLSVATNSTLHLVGPLGFSITDKEVRRAGLDYWKHVKLRTYDSYDQWEQWRSENLSDYPTFYFEVGGTKSYLHEEIPQKGVFLFGKETTGIAPEILKRNADRHFMLPMFSDKIRSLNLSNTISIVLYEAIRQQLKHYG